MTIALSIIITILGVILTILEIHKSTKKNENIKKIKIIIVFVIAISTAIISYYQGQQQDQIENTTQQIIEINNNIKKIDTEIENWISGGKSFCYLTILNEKNFMVISQGKYPVRDVYVRITDYYYGTENSLAKEQDNPKQNAEVIVNYIKYNVPYTVPNINISDYIHNNKFSLNIFIETRNNSFTQFLSGKLVNGKLEIKEDCIQEGTGHLIDADKKISSQCFKNKKFWIE